MTKLNTTVPADTLSQKQRIALVLKEMQSKIDNLEGMQYEPIAIIGMSCRFPGDATSPEEFWHVLEQEVDTVGEIPLGRWTTKNWYNPDQNARGYSYTQQGAFLKAPVDTFDADFFGIAPREAKYIDPQQRLVLEVTWEALERAGIIPGSLAGSLTGVFMGIIQSDYATLQLQSADNPFGEPYFTTGTDTSFATGRLSYLLGLQGPCMPVNTACSSSLVAIHLACQNLRLRTCNLAIAGGVNVILSPNGFIINSGLQALAPDGRCKTFDATANGFGRGEGCGVLILKRLSDAQAAGDPILAVLRGSAINHDGPSGGLTVPNSQAQERLLREALTNARLEPHEVTYVEAHGTGTVLGDPIEVQALNTVYGLNRSPENPLLIGSVKTNIGHLEAAAGVAGIIKLILAMQHRMIPASLHFHTPNPYIDWEAISLRVTNVATPWSAQEPMIAGVSSFGLSGMNAHVILSAAPEQKSAIVERPLFLLKLSAKNQQALQEQASVAAASLSSNPMELTNICYTANAGRSDFDHRMIILGDSLTTLTEQLAVFAKSPTQVIQGYVPEAKRPELVFVFTGQGAQYTGMGQKLYASQPVFRAAVDRCATVLNPLLNYSLQDILFSVGDPALINQTKYTQPALFALEYALSELWRSWGIVPHIVFGHSVGEYVAAAVAGVFSLEAALHLIAARGRLMQAVPDDGAMAAIFGNPEQVIAAVAPYSHKVSIAAFNDPNQTVISGEKTIVEQIAREFTQSGVRVQFLAVSHAFHSPLMQSILAEFQQIATNITYRAPQIPLISNLTGYWAENEIASAEYWCRHVLEPVRFVDSVRFLQTQSTQQQIIVEIGPQPVLLSLIEKSCNDLSPILLPSLRRSQPDEQVLLRSLANLYVNGVSVDWRSFEQPFGGCILPSWPTYPFQREHTWIDAPVQRRSHSVSIEDWLYTLEWQHADTWIPKVFTSHQWLVIDNHTGIGAALATSLSKLGIQVKILPATKAHTVYMDEYHILLSDNAMAFDRIIDTRPMDLKWPQVTKTALLEEDFDLTACTQSLQLMQYILQQGIKSRLWLLTTGAQAVSDQQNFNPLQASIWGIGRSFALEHPQNWGGLIDLDPDTDVDTAYLATVLAADDDEDQIIIRKHQRFVSRMVPLHIEHPLPVTLNIKGQYIITGGLGFIGLSFAEWLVDHGVKNITLLSRRTFPDRTIWNIQEHPDWITHIIEMVHSLESRGACIEIVALDISDRSAVQTLLASFDNTDLPLRGIIHSAGIMEPHELQDLTPADLQAHMSGKVSGAWNFHQLISDYSLDLWLSCSSVAAVWGLASNAAYAAANAVLDTFAQIRRSVDLTALSIAWGPWNGGMAGTKTESFTKLGLHLIEPHIAHAVVNQILHSKNSYVIVAQANWDVLVAAYAAKAHRPIFDSLVKAEVTTISHQASSLRQHLSQVLLQDRLEYIQLLIQQWVIEIMELKITPSWDQGFFDMGMDSLMAVELKRRIETELDVTLSTTLTFDYPTITSLADYLVELSTSLALPDNPAFSLSRSEEPIAIIGMACRLPGGANTPELLWEMLLSEGDGVQRISSQRWNVDAFYDPDPNAPGKSYVKSAALIDDIDCFDAQFFNITPREANNIDPQHRLLLETSWEALERAGIAPDTLKGSATGVFIGITTNDYGSLYQNVDSIDAYYSIGNSLNAAAGRIAYVLGLRGPSIAVDTACSSSLVALHLACRSLVDGECKQALVGGVNAILSPTPMIALSKFRALAPDGRCKTFDDHADGYGRGEGAGMLVLKRLSDAQADGDPILAVVRGSAVSQDGASSGLTVPNGLAQETVIRQALAVAGVQPHEIQCIEAHGTGTPLGDPIEVQALGAVLSEGRRATDRVILSSIKSNIGHLESAAGVAGLIKLILAFRHSVIPAQIHFTTPNQQIDWQNLPFNVPSSAQAWPQTHASRFAGISSFGFSGTLAHAILEEPPVPVRQVDSYQRPYHILTLSAKTDKALAELVRRYQRMLIHNPANLGDLAYTINTGRMHLPQRVAVVAQTASVALEALATWETQTPHSKLFTGRKQTTAGRVKLTFVYGDLKLAHLQQGQLLYHTSPLARQLFQRCSARFETLLMQPLLHWLEEQAWLEDGVSAALDQALLYLIQTTLTDLLIPWGVIPDNIGVEGSGLYAAAYTAGLLSLEDGLELAIAYGRLLDILSPEAGRLSHWPKNIPSTVLPQLEDSLDKYHAVCKQISFGEIRIPLLSEPMFENWQDASTWIDYIQQTNTLTPLIQKQTSEIILVMTPVNICLENSIVVKETSWEMICAVIAQLYTHGVSINWSAFDQGYSRHKISDLPTYPFARERFWISDSPSVMPVSYTGHWFLGQRLRLPNSPDIRYEQHYSTLHPPIVNDHRIFGVQTVAGATHISLMLTAAIEALKLKQCQLNSILLLRPLVIADDETRTVQVALLAANECYKLEVHSCLTDSDNTEWLLHSTGTVGLLSDKVRPLINLGDLQQRIHQHCIATDFYIHFWERHYHLGTSFRWLTNLWRHESEGLAQLSMPEITDSIEAYTLHPGLIDSCLQVIDYCISGITNLDFNNALYVPFTIQEVCFYSPPHGELWTHVKVEASEDITRFIGTVVLFNSNGDVFAELIGFEARRLTHQYLLDMLHPQQHEDMIYLLNHQALPLLDPISKSQIWVFCTNQPSAFNNLVIDLQKEKAIVHLISMGDQQGFSGLSESVTAPYDPSEFVKTLKSLHGITDQLVHIVYAWLPEALDSSINPLDQMDGVTGLLHLVKGLILYQPVVQPKLWVLTYDTGITNKHVYNFEQSFISGLSRAIAQEHPAIWGGLVDLELNSVLHTDTFLGSLNNATTESIVGVYDGHSYGVRLQAYQGDTSTVHIRSDHSYLITGGLGGIGITLVEWFINQGARSLILVNRSVPKGELALRIQEWQEQGIQLFVAQCDIAEPLEVEQLFIHINNLMPPLAGVIHAAAVFDDGMIINQTADRFLAVLRPKVAGAWWLHQQTGDRQLDFFILFSSLVSILASPGQANYIAANVFLDKLAQWRRSQGLVAQSISWGPWADIGAAAALGAIQAEQWQQRGISMMSPTTALQAFQSVLGISESHVVIAKVDWMMLQQNLSVRDTTLLLPLLNVNTLELSTTKLTANLAESEVLQILPTVQGLEQLHSLVHRVVANVLGLDSAHSLTDDQRLFDIGIDSLMAIETRDQLAHALGCLLPATLVFDYPSINSIITFIWRDTLEYSEIHTDTSTPVSISTTVNNIEHLSDEEIEALLLAKLDSLDMQGEKHHD